MIQLNGNFADFVSGGRTNAIRTGIHWGDTITAYVSVFV
jgi:hypothetical protein